MFLNKADIINTGIHQEILDALTRNSQESVETVIAYSIDEMAGYLNSRYDINMIFSQVGNGRNASILQKLIDIAIYHIHAKGNPRQLPDIRVKRYDDAIDWLKAVQGGNILPPGLPLKAEDQAQGSGISYGSNPKRNNHY